MIDKVRDIPFRNVNHSWRTDLSNKLDPDSPVWGRNWKMLAEKLGFNIDMIESFQVHRERSTILVMQEYSKMKGNSVGKFYDVLKEIGRSDAYEILEKAVPDILKSYERESFGLHMSSAVEHSDCSNLQTNNFCQMCSTSCNDFTTRCNNSLMHRCMSQCDSVQSGFLPQQCPAAVMENHTSHHHSCFNCDSMTDFKSHHMQPHLKMNIPACHSGMTHLSPISPKNEICSMSMNLNSLNYQDVESMEVGQDAYEAPLPLHEGLARQQLTEVPQMRNALDWMVGAEEEVTTSEEMSPDNDSEYFNSMKLNRQVSEENNYDQSLSLHQINASKSPMLMAATSPINTSPPITSSAQPLVKLKQFTNESKFLPTQNYRQYINNAQSNIQQEDRMKMPIRRIKCEPVDTPFNCSQQSPNLDNLKHVSDGFFQRAFPRASEEQSSGAATIVDQQSTSLPRRRVKNNSTGSSIPDSILYTRTLCKSPSLPDNMKLSEYKKKKAFKDISIFVTYSYDNEIHVKKVINLCNCIGKNGFSCCMDLFDRKLELPENEKEQWYRERFYKADFVLVCISPAYRADITRPPTSTSVHPPDQLHTRHIYQLMYDQYKKNGSKTPRFVPLLFQESDKQYIPHWLQDTLKYYWPSQWKDLLWMLTKPEERMKPLPKSRNKNAYS